MSGIRNLKSNNIELKRNSTAGVVEIFNTSPDCKSSISLWEEEMYHLYKVLIEYQKIHGENWLERVKLSPLKIAFNKLEQAGLEFEFKIVGDEIKYFIYPTGEKQAKYDWWMQINPGTYSEKEVIEFINRTIIDLNNMVETGLDIFG